MSNSISFASCVACCLFICTQSFLTSRQRRSQSPGHLAFTKGYNHASTHTWQVGWVEKQCWQIGRKPTSGLKKKKKRLGRAHHFKKHSTSDSHLFNCMEWNWKTSQPWCPEHLLTHKTSNLKELPKKTKHKCSLPLTEKKRKAERKGNEKHANVHHK